jgi:integrase
MASIKARKGKTGTTYRASIVRKGYPRQTGTFDTKRDAELWASEVEAGMLGGTAPKAVTIKRTVAALLDEYMAKVTHKKWGKREECIRLTRLKRTLPFANKNVSDVTARDIVAWKESMQTMISEQTKRALAPNSVRREFGMLHAVFEHALRPDWKWLHASPFVGIDFPPKGAPRKQRWTDADVRKVVLALGYRIGTTPKTVQQYIAWTALWALETAMRKGEITKMRADMLDTKARVLALPGIMKVDGVEIHVTKNGKARDIPLLPDALALLKLLPATSGPLVPVDVATHDVLFRRACKRAGLASHHFHDIRREATTRLASIIDNPMTLAKITGHEDFSILQKTYYTPNMSDIAMQLAKRKRAAQ